MISEKLEPKLGLLSEQHILVQAWKKTAAYIRSHNWYADTLALDRAAVNLPKFLDELADQLTTPDKWLNDPLRIVPAPKSQNWQVVPDTGQWKPVKAAQTARKIRPLAHVSLKDQVASTALMLCLADRVETRQGDPRASVDNEEDRRGVVSYGNRLFCDSIGGRLHHRWGSTKLYRGYFQDYRRFLLRPEAVAEDHGSGVVIVHSDLRQFYDRVQPELLTNKIHALCQGDEGDGFFAMARRILCWNWHEKDFSEVDDYAKTSGLSNFSNVALPQGLVAAGFFANIVLLDFDEALRAAIGTECLPGAVLVDACRYVDDIRLVLRGDGKPDLKNIERDTFSWLQGLLDHYASGLQPSEEKTQAALFRADERPLVQQSRKMERIQKAISGGFDAIGGEEILDSVLGLVRAQSRYSQARTESQGWTFSPVPDVRDETVARFAAARYRTTFRSLRPLLEDMEEARAKSEDPNNSPSRYSRVARTREDLDDETRAFALGLIENWIEDPSNVRLLRIGLDLWPAADVLEKVLQLLRQYTSIGGKRKAPRRVAWYCLAEIFRAGSTETGFVDDEERLPNGIDIDAYRAVLLQEAERLAALSGSTLPWYLKQQVLLFLAANNPDAAPVLRSGTNPETKHYRDLILYLKGEINGLGDQEFSTNAILARRSFLDANQAFGLVFEKITPNRVKLIAECDPSFGWELLSQRLDFLQKIPSRVRHDLCFVQRSKREGWTSLDELVLGGNEVLRNEATLLEFVRKCLKSWPTDEPMDVIAPSDVLVRFDKNGSQSGGETIAEVDFLRSKVAPAGSLYLPPEWCRPQDKWRLQLGYLLRFILSGQHDFTRAVRLPHWKEGTATYRAAESHWYQRRYGLHNGHSTFGADWLPITDWTEQFLYALLAWPGCQTSEFYNWVSLGIETTLELVKERAELLWAMRGQMSDTLLLPLSSAWPEKPTATRPLRVCVLQTVIPSPKGDFNASDLTFSDPDIRRRHRRHLSAALAAVERMLDLRETHKGSDGRLDFLILPELAVHPQDVETHLIPFARAHKTIILAGLTYEELFSGQPLINSAVWLIPVWSPVKGLEILRRRQGKQHLAPDERRKNTPVAKLQGFRPCQWLVGYEWDHTGANRPLRLTGSICFDATDIQLAADLRDKSDVFAVAAMNKDINTFDQMALALQYHMFQMVIVANNGTFGGSNAYAPYRKSFERQVFHLHGQPQASMAFLEIDDIDAFLRRGPESHQLPVDSSETWKCPPAGICSGETCLGRRNSHDTA